MTPKTTDDALLPLPPWPTAPRTKLFIVTAEGVRQYARACIAANAASEAGEGNA